MLEREARATVTAFMDDNEANYRQLLHALRTAVEAAKLKLGAEVVFNIYSRSDKQSDGQEFKSRAKIASKLVEKSATNPGFTVADIADIAGLTVVVYYNDQIAKFIEALQEEMPHQLLQVELFEVDGHQSLTKVHRDRGYHATHLKLISGNPGLTGLKVELQIKTMLHDAWGAKMHELTYKPRGKLDSNLRVLMESMGDGLQGIEKQSELLRDTIAKQWIPVQRLRTEARAKLIEALLKGRKRDESDQAAIDAVLERVRAEASHLSNCAPADSRLLSITQEISALSAVGIDALTRLRLAVYVSSLRHDTPFARLVDQLILEWGRSQPDPTDLALGTAFAYRQTNRLELAIDHLRKALEPDPGADSSVPIFLELADYLLESCLYATDTKATKQEVEQILHYIEAQVGGDGMPSLARFNFMRAASDIVLGEPKELDDALSLAQQSKDEMPDEMKGYCDVYIGYGWQRKLTVE